MTETENTMLLEEIQQLRAQLQAERAAAEAARAEAEDARRLWQANERYQRERANRLANCLLTMRSFTETLAADLRIENSPYDFPKDPTQ